MKKKFSKEFDMVYLCGICLSVRCADSPCGRDSEQSDLAQQLAYQAALTMYYDDRYSIQNDYPDYVIERISDRL